jgi:hypothetical protein
MVHVFSFDANITTGEKICSSVDRYAMAQDKLVRYFYIRRSYGSTSTSLSKDIILSYSVKQL